MEEQNGASTEEYTEIVKFVTSLSLKQKLTYAGE